MSKVNEMAQTIKELRSAAAIIADAADWLARQFGGDCESQENSNAPAAEEVPWEETPVEADAPVKEAPVPEPSLRLEDVRAVLADLSRKGYTDKIRDLLHQYGASKLSAVDPANYRALLRDAEGLNHAD